MKVSDYVIDFVARQGVSHIFEFIGGAITHLIDSAGKRDDVACVSVHHEQAAAFAAEAYARMNGKLGVAMATSGPGALNLMTGIGSCYFDSVPCLFITGQVNTYEYKYDRPVRQIGFQETDIVSVAKPLVKYATMLADPKRVRYELEKAVYIAQGGRPGPVLLDIPMNVQREHVETEALESFYGSDEFNGLALAGCPKGAVSDTLELLAKAKRPIILAGGGVRTSGAAEEFRAFVEKTGVPVVCSLMGLDSIPHSSPSFIGMIGAYGNRYANLALANCDFLLVLGSRLDSRQTGTRPDTFARGAKKVHVDIDANELNAKVKADIVINCHLGDFLKAANAAFGLNAKGDYGAWHKRLDGYRKRYPTHAEQEPQVINPNLFLEKLSVHCSEGDIVCLDVGQNQMWAAQSFRLKEGQRMLISGGMGAMGFSLPSAIGAVYAAPGHSAIVISGDGGIQINIQELDTVARHRLPVKIFILDNGCLGMVRQFQDMYFDGRRYSTVIGYGCPNLRAIAEAYGIPVATINSIEGADKVIDEALGATGPFFVDVKLVLDTCVNPKLMVNRPLEDMSPHLDRDKLKKEMLIDLAEEKDVPK